VAFGPNYSFLLLDLMYTSKFSATDAPFILGLYCFYVALMAINGTFFLVSMLLLVFYYN
jgi:oligosaccharide translocation protein RFT1